MMILSLYILQMLLLIHFVNALVVLLISLVLFGGITNPSNTDAEQ